MTDLEQLSREAAKVLHTEKTEFSWQHYSHTSERYIGKIVLPRHKWDGCLMWLHESTEACAEIMVRVLMPERVDLDWIAAGEIYASRRPDYQGTHPSIIIAKVREADEMQVFRTAVLRALIEVKK